MPCLTDCAPSVLVLPRLGLPAVLADAGYDVIPWLRHQGHQAQLLRQLSKVGALVTTGSVAPPPSVVDAAVNLSLICCIGAGYETFDPRALKARGIRLVHGGSFNAEDVADLALGLAIAANRRIVEADRWVRTGQWPVQHIPSRRLRGQRLGIVGLGSIGAAVATRASAFGLEVGWWGPRAKMAAWPRLPDCETLAEWADILVICAPSTADNRGLVGPAVLEALGPSGILINVARGTLVDEAALISALKNKRIAAAGLDVFAEEPTDPRKWADVPNAVLHPHRGGSTFEAIAECHAAVIDNLRRHFAGEPLRNALN